MPFRNTDLEESNRFKQQVKACLNTPVQRQEDLTRKRRVLAAVLQEWEDVGFLLANMTAIAKRAGVSTATLYRLFPERPLMNLQALALGHELILAALTNRVTHPNPIRNITELLHHYVAILLERQYRQFYLAQTFQVRQDSPSSQAASEIAQEGYRSLNQFWQSEITNLVAAGFVEQGDVELQMYRLLGPIEARAVHWFQAGRGVYVPRQSWLHEVVAVVDGFFRIYGTKKYQTFQNTFNWDWVGHAIGSLNQHYPRPRTSEKAIDRKTLPLIGDFERCLSQAARPTDFVTFATRELERMTSHKANRLSTSNRRSRIVAAAIYENYERGFENLSMSAIAKRAGVSTATLYRVFPDDITIYDEAHALVLSFFCAWVGQDNDHINPIARMTEYIMRPLETYCDPATQRLGSIQYGFITRVEEGTILPTAPLLIRYIYGFWVKRFGRLVGENYISQTPSWPMIHDIFGPIQSMSWALQSCIGIMPLPQDKWYDTCWQISADFFKIYGTPYFHARRASENWDGDRDILRH